MKVAYYSPLPPSRSGIADYSALLLPELEKRIDVVPARPGRFRRDPQADIALYHVGNDAEAHGWIVEALRRRPGVVVLHDFVLHHLVVGLTFARGDSAGYLAAMEREGGLVGRLLAYAVLDNKLPPLWETRPEDFPLAGEVLDHATGLIVHSRYVERRARESGFRGPIALIPHPAWPLPEIQPADVGGVPLYGCFGHLNETKRIAELVSAFERLRERRPGARLLLVGSLAVRLSRLELPEGVEHREYVPENELWSLMAACDAIVSLRSPTMGETSGSAIRALSLGKPLVVSDVGWFAELPADAVVKVPVDEHEEDTLLAALEALADPAVRAAMGERARELVEREHRVDRVAEAYAAVLETNAGGAVVEERVLHEVASAASRGRAWTATTRPFSRRGCARSDLATSAASASPRARAAELVRAIPMWAWVGGLVIVSAGIRYALARRIVAPWIMVDELVYSELAKSFADAGRFLLRGEHTAAYGLVYPAILSPAWALFDRVPQAYAAAKAINAVVVSLAAIPAYLLARRACSRPYRVRRGRAGDVGADAALRGDADDRERVLPGVPARRAGDGRSGWSGPTCAERSSCSARSCSRT